MSNLGDSFMEWVVNYYCTKDRPQVISIMKRLALSKALLPQVGLAMVYQTGSKDLKVNKNEDKVTMLSQRTVSLAERILKQDNSSVSDYINAAMRFIVIDKFAKEYLLSIPQATASSSLNTYLAGAKEALEKALSQPSIKLEDLIDMDKLLLEIQKKN